MPASRFRSSASDAACCAAASRSCAMSWRRSFQPVEVFGQRLGFTAQFRQYSAQRRRSANGLGHVPRLEQDRRRRIAPHALQGRQNLRDQSLPAGERSLKRPRVAIERVQALICARKLALGVLHRRRRVDQRLGQPRSFRSLGLHVGFNLFLLRLARLQQILNPPQLRLRGAGIGRWRGLRRRRLSQCRPRHETERRQRARRPVESGRSGDFASKSAPQRTALSLRRGQVSSSA